jgi:hypothetical protein
MNTSGWGRVASPLEVIAAAAGALPEAPALVRAGFVNQQLTSRLAALALGTALRVEI